MEARAPRAPGPRHQHLVNVNARPVSFFLSLSFLFFHHILLISMTSASTRSCTSCTCASETSTSSASSGARSKVGMSGGPSEPAAVKAATLHLPLRLPPPPITETEVDLSTLVVDPELRDKPVGMIVGRMRQLGLFSKTFVRLAS